MGAWFGSTNDRHGHPAALPAPDYASFPGLYPSGADAGYDAKHVAGAALAVPLPMEKVRPRSMTANGNWTSNEGAPVMHNLSGTQSAQREGGDWTVSRERGDGSLIEPLAAEWQELCAEGPCDEPFYTPAWVRSYLAAFEPQARLTLITIRKGKALRGVLPLVERTIGHGPVRLRWYRTAANSHFPRFDVIHGAGDRELVTEALWTFLQSWSGWDLLQFESAPEPGVAWSLVDLAAGAGHRSRRHRPDASPYVDVTRYPRGVDEIITTRSSNLRSQSRRSLKRLRDKGSVEFRIVASGHPPDEIQAAAEAFYRLEASGWKGEAGTAILSDPATKAFYDLVVANAQKTDSLVICLLLCDGDLVAAGLKLRWNTTLYELKAGYNEAYSKWSPGHLAKVHTLDAAPDLGVEVLDNCGRADAHKLVWTDLSRPFATGFVFNRTPRGRLAWALLFRLGPVVRERFARYPLPDFVKRALG